MPKKNHATSALASLEDSLNNLLVVKGPKLSEKAKKTIVQFLPYIALLLGLFGVINWWELWTWGHVGQTEVNFAKEYAQTYNTELYVPSRMTFAVWAGLVLMALQVALYYASYTGLRLRKKAGWNLLFYAGIASLAYSFFLLFYNQDLGPFLRSILSTTAGFYFLFQVRALYVIPVERSTK